jgi:hypothetical protein
LLIQNLDRVCQTKKHFDLFASKSFELLIIILKNKFNGNEFQKKQFRTT